ncbi:hypothetical protein WN944_006318 [Citrus x changshan-huyou]|uniref:Uncharacterized protein n=1 Tax=Citrus x changshan-huyou TaxID=2935761 RepID=A0AAP0ML43_9ROSI
MIHGFPEKHSCNNSDIGSLHFIDKFSNGANANLHVEIKRLLQVKDLHSKPSELEDERWARELPTELSGKGGSGAGRTFIACTDKESLEYPRFDLDGALAYVLISAVVKARLDLQL